METKFTIITDPIYGYRRAEPVPTQEEVEEFYKQEFYSSDYKNFNDSSLEVQKEEEEFFDSRWEAVCTICKDFFGKTDGLSLFDIGFGFAQALLYFRGKGMQVSGLEPSPEGVQYARSQGMEVHNAGIEDFDCVGTKRFDVVTLFNVLEHLRNPAETLINIRRKLLTPDGLLVIDVPNEFNDFQTVADSEYDLRQWWVCPPNHINYFSASSLKELLQRCNYRVIHSEASFPLEIFLLMGEVYIGDGKLGKSCHNRRVNFERLMRKHGKAEKLRRFYQSLADLDLGRQIVVYATPIQP